MWSRSPTISRPSPVKLSPTVTLAACTSAWNQQPALFPDLTVAENIALRLEPATAVRRVHWPDRRARAAQLLRRIGADIAPEAEVRSLSMPEQQLVKIACALGASARVLIMDEPTATGGPPVPLRWKRRGQRNFVCLSMCRACEWLNAYHPGGVPEPVPQHRRIPGLSTSAGLWHPSRVHSESSRCQGVSSSRLVWTPQPPANVCESFGRVTVRR